MADRDKALAVTNGAFSCRIEGFDRPADIVRLVERYLQQHPGSHNPDVKKPDAKVLARIVGSTIGTGVRAYTRDGVTVLSPSVVAPHMNCQLPSGPVAAARAFKIKRADFESAVAKGYVEEITETTAPPSEANAGCSLGTDQQVRAMLTGQRVGDGTSSDVTRLIGKANDEMGKPGGLHGRKAIAHLRAAVAATRAGLGLSRNSGAGNREHERCYRQDLAKVVRARSIPADPSDHVARHKPHMRHAKLRLEAEQRVAPSNQTPPPLGLHSIEDRLEPLAPPTSEQLSPPPNPKTFAAFARDMRAVDLPDLMEAAAAYLTFVERCALFSRHQLMSTLRRAQPADCSRNDRLQCFADLLSHGKIQKQRGEMFAVTERISFAPVDRDQT